jgi:probable phosphoglycerate mutase
MVAIRAFRRISRMNAPTHVLLVRHGRTLLNAEGRLRGLANPELDEVGIIEARATARALKPLQITRVLSSPLHRAATTAEIIADEAGVTNEVDPAFNDRDYGPWTGHIKADVIKQWGSVDAAPGVEDSSIVFNRAMPALTSLVNGATPGVIAIVTHDAVIRPILESIQPGIEAEMDNGSWADISFDQGSWKLVSVDNTA